MPKPKPTTEICSKVLERACERARNGWVKIRPKISPKASARGGEAQGEITKIRPKMKSSLDVRGGDTPVLWTCCLISLVLSSRGVRCALSRLRVSGSLAVEAN